MSIPFILVGLGVLALILGYGIIALILVVVGLLVALLK